MKVLSAKSRLFFIGFSLFFLPMLLVVFSAQAQTSTVKQKYLAKKQQIAIDLGEHYDGSTTPNLSSAKALIVNQATGKIKYAKNSQQVSPIASITKLMTAMVVLDAEQSLDQVIRVANQDVDTIKNTWSRLTVGTALKRSDMLQLALMASENRAAFSLARNYPGGTKAFVKAMNKKAVSLGLVNTHFAGPTGLMYQNRSTAEDLYKIVVAAYRYPEIRQATTTPFYSVKLGGKKQATKFKNTNKLIREGEWEIGLSKTGFIDEAGRCLVMQTTVDGEDIIAVFLDAEGSNKRLGDANRIRKWIEYHHREKAEKKNTIVAQQRYIPQLKLELSEHLEN